jgi:hypothetical protein
MIWNLLLMGLLALSLILHLRTYLKMKRQLAFAVSKDVQEFQRKLMDKIIHNIEQSEADQIENLGRRRGPRVS